MSNTTDTGINMFMPSLSNLCDKLMMMLLVSVMLVI